MTTPSLTPIQTQAVARLLAGQSVTAVARELKIDRSTIYDWRNTKPHFRQALEEGRTRLHELTADGLADLAATAIDTLRHLLTSLTTPPSVRLRAAESVLRSLAAQQQQQQQPDKIQQFPAVAAAPPPSQEDAAPVPVPAPAPAPARSTKVGRNELCPCGSQKKYKRCCGNPLAPAEPIPQNPTDPGTPIEIDLAAA